MKKTFGFNKISGMHKHSANRGIGIASQSQHPSFPSWNGSDASNWSIIEDAYNSRVLEEQNATIDSYYSISIPSADYHNGCLAPNGCIYFVPFNTGKKVLKFDTSTETYELIGNNLSGSYVSCVLTEGGYIYSAPTGESSSQYLKINTNTDTVETVSSSGSRYTWHSVLAPNNLIYHAKATLQTDSYGERFDISTETESLYGPVPEGYYWNPAWGPVITGYYAQGQSMRGSHFGAGIALCGNNIIYQAPNYYEYRLMAIDPSTNSVYAQGNVGNSGTAFDSRQMEILGSYGNKLYLMVNGSIFRIYDVTTNTYETISFPSVPFHSTVGKIATNGCMYFISSSINGYVKLNTLTNEVSTISTPSSLASDRDTVGFPNNVMNLILAPNGKLYHADGNKIHVLNVTNKAYPIDFCLSRYINHS